MKTFAPRQASALPRAAPRMGVRGPQRASLVVRSSADVEEIDPYTGEVISKKAMAKEAGLKVKAGKYTWAYRTGEVDAAKAAEKPTILLVHGLGSSSYSFRAMVAYMGGQNYNAIAPDWLGHGDSDKPTDFEYTEQAFVRELSNFVEAAKIKTPLVLIVHGYYLGQFGLKWALENEDKVDKLIILNTPLTAKAPLPPSFAAYKNPLAFLRPKGNFDAMNHNAGGGPYAMQLKDAQVFQKPYDESPAATEALLKVLDKTDFKTLCSTLDEEFTTWRVPSLLLFGGADSYLDANVDPFNFLESKRTNMRIIPHSERCGHYPQEDQGEVTADIILQYLEGKIDMDNFKTTSGLLDQSTKRTLSFQQKK